MRILPRLFAALALGCVGVSAYAQGLPPSGYPNPGYAPPPGYPEHGYGPPPRYGEDRSYWERCERLRHEEHELRDRLAYTPYGGERERLQHRLGRVEAERQQCRRR